jgi:hypothetical protein
VLDFYEEFVNVSRETFFIFIFSINSSYAIFLGVLILLLGGLPGRF